MSSFGFPWLQACGKAKELDEAFELLEGYENRLKNTAPRRLYIMLLNACAEAGDVRRARAMMHRIGCVSRGPEDRFARPIREAGEGVLRVGDGASGH